MSIIKNLFASGWNIKNTFFDCITLLLEVTATGDGDIVDLGALMSRFTCTVEWSGTTPTSTTVKLKGSIDGDLWADLQTVVIAGSGTMFHIIDKSVRYVRGNYASRVGGDGTTAVTMKCSGGY